MSYLISILGSDTLTPYSYKGRYKKDVRRDVAFCKWKKNKVWIWRAIDGVSRQAIGCVLGDRNTVVFNRLYVKCASKKLYVYIDN